MPAVMHSRRKFAAAASIGVMLATIGFAGVARADKAIVSAPQTIYLTPQVTMDQGEPLTLYNFDTAGHDVTSVAQHPGGTPLFSTPIIGFGEAAFVVGSQYLTTGSYEFFCSIHQYMVGTLTVTSAGTPVPSPGSGPKPADTAAPVLALRFEGRRKRKLLAEVSVDEPATVALNAVARVSGRRVTVAKGTVDFTGAGRRKPALALTRAGRSALARPGRLGVTLSARAVDRAGNVSSARVKRRLA